MVLDCVHNTRLSAQFVDWLPHRAWSFDMDMLAHQKSSQLLQGGMCAWNLAAMRSTSSHAETLEFVSRWKLLQLSPAEAWLFA